MFSWLTGADSNQPKSSDVFENVADGLKNIYKEKLLPLEKTYFFHNFHSQALDDPFFSAKLVLHLFH